MFGYVSILCLCLHLVSAGQAVPLRNGRDPKSAAEQVNEKLLEAREQKLIARDMVNVIEAWKARLGLPWYREIMEYQFRTNETRSSRTNVNQVMILGNVSVHGL